MHKSIFAGKRIFVVEDDVCNMAVMAVTLKYEGATVIQDPWTSGTIDLLTRTLPIDLILLDLMLRNGKSGFDIFDLIKAVPELASIPVVLVTASNPEREALTARNKGFDGFIAKPINASAFPQQILPV